MENVSKRQILLLLVHLRHIELTRAELLGRLGIIPMNNKHNRFALSYLHTSSFLEELNRIQALNQEENLLIPCSSSEIDQFDVSRLEGLIDQKKMITLPILLIYYVFLVEFVDKIATIKERVYIRKQTLLFLS
ncbi:MAG: hypothetical protein NT163_13030 [Chlorobiales bacterium]|nr:hypothetical protein [Chlorobiales bacterium]